MADYTEEKRLHVTITHGGNKEVREEVVILKDGVEVGRSNHRYVVDYDQNVPVDVAAHINSRRGKQPTRPELPDV